MNYFKISKIFLCLVPLAVAIVTTSTLFPFIVGKYVWFRTLIDLALIFFLLGLIFDKHEFIRVKTDLYGLRRNPLVIAVTVFVIIFLLACFFGIDPKMSFWSNFERGEGGLQLLHLWLFFILLMTLFKEEKDWQRIFILAIIGGLGMALYGLFAGLKMENFIGPKFGDIGFRFQGSIGNPAYVAAYAIFMLFYTAYLLASKYKDRLLSFGASAFWFLMAVFIVVFFAAATRGAFMGFIAAVLVFIGYLAFSSKRWRKWLIVLGVGLLLAVILLIQFKNTTFIKSLPLSRIFDISFSTQTFHDRAIMWKIAIDGFKERPLLGWGPENYIQVFDRYFNTEYFVPSQGFGAWFDRAHSIYFDYLVETGILGLLSFLGIWIVFYWQFIKKTLINTDKKLINADNQHKSAKISINPRLQNQHQSVLQSALLFALPIAYLVQGIVLFDVFPIYLNVFLMLAFAAYRFEVPNLKHQIPNKF